MSPQDRDTDLGAPTTYPAPIARLLGDPEASAAALDKLLHRITPAWLSWEVPTILLELDRGHAPVCPENQAKIRGLYALHLAGECFVAPRSFDALAWLFAGVEAPGLRPNPVDMLHVFDQVRAIATAHNEPVPEYALEVIRHVADTCRREGYIALPGAYADVQDAVRRELTEEGAAIEKKAQQLAQRALSNDSYAFPETAEGVAAARRVALEQALTRPG